MTVLTLSKHHGLGNDFLVLLDLAGDTPIDAALARAVCDRHRGLGADGLIRATLVPDDGARARTRVERAAPAARAGSRSRLLTFELRNADGSAAEMSGNGMRCLAQAALDAGVVPADRPFRRPDPGGPPDR